MPPALEKAAVALSLLTFLIGEASAAEITTRFLDEVSLPTIGAIHGGLTGQEDTYYFGSDAEETAGLWRTDGTPLGTVQLTSKAVAAFKISAPPALYFWVGEALWRTQGIPHRERLIDATFGRPSEKEESRFAGLNGALYWLDSVAGGWDLRRIENGNGTQPTRVLHIVRGSAPAFAGQMTPDARGGLLFLAPDSETGTTALWITDGTPAGTVILDSGVDAGQAPVGAPHAIYYTKRLDGRTRLFRTRGTRESSARVLSAEEEDFENPTHFLVEPDSLFFQAADPAHGKELWRVDHASETAIRVIDLNPGNNSASPEPLVVFQEAVWAMARVSGSTRLWHLPLTEVDSKGPGRVDWLGKAVADHHFLEAITRDACVYLVSAPSMSDPERWLTRSDGTAKGTESFEPEWLTEAEADGLPHLYPIEDGVLFPSRQIAVGTEIHTLRNESETPDLVKDANVTPIEGARATLLQSVARSTAIQYFTITRENEHAFVHLDREGARTVVRSGEATQIGWALTVNETTGITFFRDQRGLWSLLPGGSTPGLVYDEPSVRPEIQGRNIPFATTDSGIFFLAANRVFFNMLHSDGVVGGRTELIVRDWGYQDQPRRFDGRHYFLTSQPALSVQPRSTTGPERSTPFVNFASAVRVMGSTGSHLYFSQGNQLWSYDGNFPLRSVGAPAAVSFLVVPPVADADDRFFYLGQDDKGIELWVTDGTSRKAERLTDIDPGQTVPIEHLTPVGDALFFAAHTVKSGLELWMSDGTAEGTAGLTDFLPGAASSLPRNREASVIGALGDYAYFAADDGIHGVELWRAHRSGAPIELVQDLVPGPGSSHPQNFVSLNGRLFLQAVDPSHTFLTLREVVSQPEFDAAIKIESQADRIRLHFGENANSPYLLMESSNLEDWDPIGAFSGASLDVEQSVEFEPRPGARYFRLHPN